MQAGYKCCFEAWIKTLSRRSHMAPNSLLMLCDGEHKEPIFRDWLWTSLTCKDVTLPLIQPFYNGHFRLQNERRQVVHLSRFDSKCKEIKVGKTPYESKVIQLQDWGVGEVIPKGYKSECIVGNCSFLIYHPKSPCRWEVKVFPEYIRLLSSTKGSASTVPTDIKGS